MGYSHEIEISAESSRVFGSLSAILIADKVKKLGIEMVTLHTKSNTKFRANGANVGEIMLLTMEKTDTIFVETPHVVWKNFVELVTFIRDKIGCPLIDA